MTVKSGGIHAKSIWVNSAPNECRQAPAIGSQHLSGLPCLGILLRSGWLHQGSSDQALTPRLASLGFEGGSSSGRASDQDPRELRDPQSNLQVSRGLPKGSKALQPNQELRPVFRSSPFESRKTGHITTRGNVKILFVDEGNCCRSVVAEAMFNRLLQRMQDSSAPLLASVESASLGPSFEEHDPRVVRLAREAGLQLGRKTQRSFDEIRDPVDYDLIVAMDRFDFEEVLKDVAVLDTIDPGGFYAARIRLFGPFAAASTSFKPDRMPWVFAEGIEDPLYGNVGGEAEQAALWGTLRKLRLACAGLAQFLHQLQDRCWGGTSLPQALSQALLCPLLGPGFPSSMQNSAWGTPLKEKDWRPVWQGGVEIVEPQIYTTRRCGDRRFIVKQPSPYYTVARGYWTDIGNLRKELLDLIDSKGLDPQKLPTNRELRLMGANQLCNAIEYHGGFSSVAQQLRLSTANRHTNGFWSDVENLKTELTQFVTQSGEEWSAGETHRSGPSMPSIRELKRSGRHDLAYAVARWGGVAKAAAIAGLPTKKSRLKDAKHLPRSVLE